MEQSLAMFIANHGPVLILIIMEDTHGAFNAFYKDCYAKS